jgi:hypothetical protein
MLRNPRVALTIDVAEAGAALARGSDEEQAVFANAFCEELLREARSHYSAQMQIGYVQDRLNKRACEVLGLPEPKEKR